MAKVKVSQLISLTIAPQTVHTVYRDRILTISMVHLVNVTGANKTVRVHYVPYGGAAAVGNAALYDYVIPANDFIEFGDGQMLLAGSTIIAACSVDAAVNISLCGVEE